MNEIPSSWAWATISELTQYIQRGKSPKYADRSDLPVINQKCIRWDELQEQHLKFINPDQFSAWGKERYIVPGDILWNSTGTGTVGRAYQVKDSDCLQPKVVDSHVTIVRHVPEVDARYLFNWIKGPMVQSKIEAMCDGTTNQIELSRAAIAATAIPVAPAAEQSRIANQLDTLLTRIQACNERLDAIPALLKRFRQTVLDAATTGALTQDWRAELGNTAPESHRPGWVKAKALHSLPEGWRWAEFSEFLSGFRSGTSAVPSGDPSAYAVLRSSSVRPMEIDYEDVRYLPNMTKVRADDLLAEGDVLFTRLSGSLEYVANCAVVRGLGDRKIYYPDRLFRAKLIRPEQGTYFELCFASPLLRKHLTVEAKSTAGHQRISMGAVTDFPIPMPPGDEQKEIIKQVGVLLRFADRIEARCTAARTQAQRLSPLVLAKAFRGELLPQDPNDEPASELLARLSAQHGDTAEPVKTRQPGKSRAVATIKESTTMTKSRQDDDVKGKPYLSDHLRRIGTPASAEALFKVAELPVGDFYKQLAWEVDQGLVKDGKELLEPCDAA